MLFRIYTEADTFLHRLNPTLKLLSFSLLLIAPTMFLDPVTPASFLLLSLLMAWVLGKISPWKLGRRLGVFLVLSLGILLFDTLFYAGPRHTLLLFLGPLSIYKEGLFFGLSISLRLLCVTSYSSIFVQTTDPTLLAYSLIKQGRLPYRVAFSILAAYRFLPLLQEELSLIRDAHKIRGGYREGLLARLEKTRRFVIPLLASGIRHAERLSISMDARGFSSQARRTYYKRVKVGHTDYLFVTVVLTTATGILVFLIRSNLAYGFLAGVAETQVGHP
jgi:energy-coupling factor transport system permease protein